MEKKVPVLPMVPAGKALDDFILWDAEVEKQQNDLRKKELVVNISYQIGFFFLFCISIILFIKSH